MGICLSFPFFQNQSPTSIESYTNDYELVIRACKEIDILLLTLSRQAHHKIEHHNPGLHELITAAEVDSPLEKTLRYLATVRNSLVHDHDVVHLKDREGFINAFNRSKTGLELHKTAREQKRYAEIPRKVTVVAH
jgi:hypothetical protein